MPTIVWLDQVDASDAPLVGGKAANLGELLRSGFEVPRGFVVTTEGYRRRNPDGSVPAVLADDIRTTWRALVGESGGAVAVRSSATAEDLAEASFAGQMETYLGVVGEDAVVTAVADCWASLHGERAVAYRAEHGVDEASLGMAVVVQLMVEADAAGVMFTANPVNGNRRQTMISAARGLGEAVVSGTVNPDTFVVDRDARALVAMQRGEPAVVEPDPSLAPGELAWTAGSRGPRALTDDQAVELSGVGDRVEARFGKPQDIEWALDAAGFHLLQARPITALPEPVAEVPDEWPSAPGNMYFRASIVEQMPTPLTPLFADLVADAVPASLDALMLDLAATMGRDEVDVAGMDLGFPTINGYAYYRYSNRSMWQFAAVTAPAIRHLLDHGGALFVDRWRDRELPAYRAAVGAWAARDLPSVAAAELLAGVADLVLAGCTYYTSIQPILPLTGLAEFTWQALHASLVGARRVSSEQYLLGSDSAPLLAEKALWDIGTWVRSEAALADALADVATDARGAAPSGVEERLWREWRDRLDGYLAEYGHTTYDLDFVHPVPADDPAPILQALRFVITGRGVDPYARQAKLIATRERVTADLLGSLDPVRARLAAGTLRWARSVVPIREDALAAIGLAWPMMRRMLAELGARLTAAGVLGDPEQVYWLNRVELAGAIAGEPPQGVAELVADRQALWRGRSRLRPPQYLPLSRLMTMWDGFLPAKTDGESGNVLKGNAGSGGLVTGPARVISGPSDFAGFVPGEVLVAEITTPAYTPLFAVAGGVVTDVGGVLSHGSIVAREYGIPAVLGTGSATHRIHTGDTITVDGGRGEVRLDDELPVVGHHSWLPWVLAGVGLAGILWWTGRRRKL